MMEIFIKSVVGVLIAVILSLSLAKQGKDTALLLVLVACVMVLLGAMRYMDSVVQFFEKLKNLGKLDNDMFRVLLKTTGIGILSEMVSTICADSGNAALGKGIQLLAVCVIIFLSIPVINELLTLIEGILT